METAERFRQSNIEAAQLIVAAGDCYDGGLLLWATRVLARERPSMEIPKMPVIAEYTAIKPDLAFQQKLDFSSRNHPEAISG